jgi:Cytochrome c oxidase assembly protein PET191
MEETDCVKKDKKPVIDCLRDPVESDDCRAQRNAYTMCKHSQLNMRTRIRGVRTY